MFSKIVDTISPLFDFKEDAACNLRVYYSTS